MCRRWRQIALQLPASLTIDLCEAHDLELGPNADERFAAAVEALLPHLRCRRIVALSISGCTSVLAPEVPVRLAGALYPELSRWVLFMCVQSASCSAVPWTAHD